MKRLEILFPSFSLLEKAFARISLDYFTHPFTVGWTKSPERLLRAKPRGGLDAVGEAECGGYSGTGLSESRAMVAKMGSTLP